MFSKKLKWYRVFNSKEELDERFIGKSSFVHTTMFGTILFLKRNGAYYAFKNRCPHQGKSLEGCIVEDDRFICPYHRYQFSLEDGKGHGMYVDKHKLRMDDSGVHIGKYKWGLF